MSVAECLKDTFAAKAATGIWLRAFAAGDTGIARDLENSELPLNEWDSLMVSLFQPTENLSSKTSDYGRADILKSLVRKV